MSRNKKTMEILICALAAAGVLLAVGGKANADFVFGTPMNLGPPVNSPRIDTEPSISSDGLELFFDSSRSGGYGRWDLWVSTRATTDNDWGTPVNLGPNVNSPSIDRAPSISADGSMLYFYSDRSGNDDLWQVPIEPIVDFNGDGIVNSADMCILVDRWQTDETVCDIGPTPLGDGIVDVHDLTILADYLFQEIDDPTLVAHWALDETEGMFVTDSAGDNNAVFRSPPNSSK